MAWNSPMKPETIARRAQLRIEQMARRREETTREIAEKAAAENDPQGFWTEMLAERLARHNREG